jgi:hypothetical protein
VTVQITQGSRDGESRAVLIGPDTPRSLTLLISFNSTTLFDDSLFLYHPVGLMISGKFIGTDGGSSLLCVGHLLGGAQDSTGVTDIRYV